MFDYPQGNATGLQLFVGENINGLLSAAFLLGGKRRAEQVSRLFADLQSCTVVTRRMRAEAESVLRLLCLENVHDPDRPEAGFFASLDPCQPYVEDICLLADGLLDALNTINNVRPTEAGEVGAAGKETS
ncbi:hypothetical protein [Limimaricola soesokkakensis]|uniref:hypothetical protein n=1 Tax=Limimaricola soesokkakensis TaxID=1343159 RepID=UPI0010545998|nr:hypothetical protein [Limimaricola soesokkakensis]